MDNFDDYGNSSLVVVSDGNVLTVSKSMDTSSHKDWILDSA